MSVQQIAANFVAGEYSDLNGIGLHDAVHVLATRFQLNKAELRVAIQALYADPQQDAEVLVEGIAERGAVEGGDA